MINCRYFDSLESCVAPLCPKMSEMVLKTLFWFSDEPVCRNEEETVEWLDKQRELKEKYRKHTDIVRFSYSMLAAC